MTPIIRTMPIIGQYYIQDCSGKPALESKVFFKKVKNIHDAYAVLCVDAKGEKLGWVPKEISPMLAYLLKKKIKPFAIVNRSHSRLVMNSPMNFCVDIYVP